MNGFARFLLVALILPSVARAADPPVMETVLSSEDVSLSIDPATPFWRASRVVALEKDRLGKTVARFRIEVRTRWTKDNLYFLFVCPFEELNLKSNPTTEQETNELWDYDVAEVFIGSDFNEIRRYKEFEVSPQGEWVDLDIDLRKPHHEDGWKWNSGLTVLAQIDRKKHMWHAAMRIPFSAIDKRSPAAGNTLRINLFVSQGPPANHHELAWQAPMNETFHVPERFGLIRLVDK